jgi:hypothetical protein
MVKPENQRVADLINFLEKEGKVKNPTDFGRKIKHDSGSLTKILKGERGVTPNFLWKIYNTFRIDKPFLFDGEGEPRYEEAKEDTTSKNPEALEEIIKSLKRTIRAMEITIKAQEITIESLQKNQPKKTNISNNLTSKKEKENPQKINKDR